MFRQCWLTVLVGSVQKVLVDSVSGQCSEVLVDSVSGQCSDSVG